nr:hypothetical protein FJN17_27035 [Bradyrhizobium symbiodeficiens]
MIVLPGLVPPARPKSLRRGEGPGIHVLSTQLRRGGPGHRRAKATPSPGRLGPAMTLRKQRALRYRSSRSANVPG